MLSKVVVSGNTLISFDERDVAQDFIRLDSTKVGMIALATVEKVLPDLKSCILNIPTLNTKGFISINQLEEEYFVTRHSLAKPVCQQDQFYVQIIQDKKGSKPCGCRFVREPGRSSVTDYYLNLADADGCELITDDRQAASDFSQARFYEDTFPLQDLYGFKQIAAQIANPIAHLKSGANIIIEPTEALCVIDINSASSKQDALSINMEATTEILRLIRLKNISGIIVIDYLKMDKEKQRTLLNFFQEKAASDYSDVTAHGFTRLGLMEVTRSKIYGPNYS